VIDFLRYTLISAALILILAALYVLVAPRRPRR